MFAQVVLTDRRRFLFVSISAFVEVAASVTNISCIAGFLIIFNFIGLLLLYTPADYTP